MERLHHREEIASARRSFLTSPLSVATFFLLFTLLLLWPLLRGALYWGDIQFYFEPMWRYGQQELRQGRIPLWNGRVLAGQPFLGNPQMGIFYPVTIGLFFLPVWLTLNLASIVHIFLCGLFTYAYLRRRVSSEAALLGAMTYMGSDCLLGRLQFPPILYTAAFFPLLLWQLDRCLDKPRLSTYAWLSVSLGLMLLAGHAQFAYFILVTGIGYALARLWRNRNLRNEEHPASWLWPAIPLIGAGLVGLLLAAVQILPTLQLLALSPREKLSAMQANRFVLDFQQLLQAIWPRFFGHPATRDFWWRGNAWEPAHFVGWLPLLLAGIALLRRWGTAQTRFWAVTGILGLWLALGLSGGLYTLAFYTLPGLANFHDPARFLLITIFAISVLTAEGWEASRTSISIAKLYPCALALVGLPLIWIAGDWNPTTDPDILERRPGAMASEALKEEKGRTYLPAHDLLWKQVVTDGYDDYGGSDATSVAFQRETLISNLGMQFGIDSSSGYEPVPLAATALVDGLGRLAARAGQPNLADLMTLTHANILILPESLYLNDPAFRPLNPAKASMRNGTARQGRVRVWVKASPSPIAWIVPQLRRVEGKARVAAALAAPDFNPARESLVSGVADLVSHMDRKEKKTWRALEDAASIENSSGSGGNDMSPASVKAILRRSGLYEFSMTARKAPALLVLASAAYPGWQARADGKFVPVVRANGVMLGMPLAAGTEKVRLIYAPDSYRLGLYLSLLALLLLSLVFGLVQFPKLSRRVFLGRRRHSE